MAGYETKTIRTHKPMTIEIKGITPDQIPEAKRVILSVAQNYYQWPHSLEEIIRQFDERGALQDVDHVQMYYLNRQGMFLVALDEGQVIGTGALGRVDDQIAELKRLWLLEAYHGRGIGYRLVQELLAFAQATGYKYIRLLTERGQSRAVHFYQRIGFQFTPCSSNDPEDVCMELAL